MNYTQWQTERKTCETCSYCIRLDDPQQDKSGTILRCGYHYSIYCIDARSEEQLCGPDAKDWKHE
jgi:hypothetical protein